VKRLKRKMKANGYDESQPIDVADVDGKLIILQGHHRAKAAAQAGLKTVPVRVFKVTQEQADELMRQAAEVAAEAP
jgi:filamentous hemagglutinin